MLRAAIVMSLGLCISSPSLFAAKRDKREGFNFGSTMSFTDRSEPSILSKEAGTKQQVSSEEQRYRAHVGYSFSGVFNLGLGFELENGQNNSLTNGLEEGSVLSHEEQRRLNGAFLFSRLLFGKLFFMQMGAGYYQRAIKASQETEYASASGSFTGQRESWSLNAEGAGFHGAMGIEIPVAFGFYATGDYTVRNLMLKQRGTSLNTAGYQGNEKQNTLNFGITHYY